MQYLLTEEEYQELKKKKDIDFRMKVDKLQELCTKIANEMPIEVDWMDEIQPWGCVLTKETDYDEWYCDHCPVQEICPNPYKSWSK